MRLEGGNYMVYLFAKHLNHVETHGAVNLPARKIEARGVCIPLHSAAVNRLGGQTEPVGRPRLYLDERHDVALARDNVNLAERAPVVAFEYFIAKRL